MKQENKPFVTVLMPAFNAEKYIELAIQSILDQTYDNFEFIIVNDCSTDTTQKIIEKFAEKDTRIKLINNKKNLGVDRALNKGLKEAQGKYIVRMDADDWSYPDRIQKQVKHMELYSEVSVSGGSTLVCDENLRPLGIRRYIKNDADIKKGILRLNPIAHPASIWRKDMLFKTQLYPHIPLAEDYALIVELSNFSKLNNMEDILIKFRIHSKSVSNAKMISQQRASLFISHLAESKYGYKPTIKDYVWRIIQRFSMYTIPPKLKRYLLNMLVLDRDLSTIEIPQSS